MAPAEGKGQQVNDRDVASTMIEFGGSFVRKLGAAALVADPENLGKIKATWPDYWDKYKRMTQQISDVEKQASVRHNSNK